MPWLISGNGADSARRYEDNILCALPAEDERLLLTASYERRDFGLDDIRHMVHIIYVDNLSRPSNAKPVAGRGIAMQVTVTTCSASTAKGSDTIYKTEPSSRKKSVSVSSGSGASKPNDHSTRLGKLTQKPEVRGEGLTESSGVRSIGTLRTATRIDECSIRSNLAVQTGAQAVSPLMIPITVSHLPQ